MTRQKRRKVEKRPKEKHGDISDWVALRRSGTPRKSIVVAMRSTKAAVTPLQFARRPGAIS
jgi:hypothetical protein